MPGFEFIDPAHSGPHQPVLRSKGIASPTWGGACSVNYIPESRPGAGFSRLTDPLKCDVTSCYSTILEGINYKDARWSRLLCTTLLLVKNNIFPPIPS